MNHTAVAVLDGCAEKNGAVPGAHKPRPRTPFFRAISDRSVASENTPHPYYSRRESVPQGTENRGLPVRSARERDDSSSLGGSG